MSIAGTELLPEILRVGGRPGLCPALRDNSHNEDLSRLAGDCTPPTPDLVRASGSGMTRWTKEGP